MAHKIMRALASFVMALALAGLAALLLLYTVGLSAGALQKSFAGSGYYEGLQRQTLQSTAATLVPTGVTGEVLENTLTAQDVQTLVQASLGKVNNSIYLLLVDDITLRLSDNVAGYVTAQGLDTTEYTREIDEIVEYVVAGYTQSASFPLGTQIAKLQTTAGRYVPFMASGLIVVIIFAALVLMRQRRSTGVRYTAYALGGAGLILFIVPLLLRVTGLYTRISLQPQYFYSFFVTHINRVLGAFIAAGAAMLVIAAAIAIIHELVRRQRAAK